MSATDIRGLNPRADRLDSLAESLQDRRAEVSRRRWMAVLMVTPMVLIPAFWSGGEYAERVSAREASRVGPIVRPSVPMELNPRVERFITAFQTTRKDEFDLLMRRRGIYADMIRVKLRERGMPDELIYIPMIESGLSPFAVSQVSAVGMWQFMGPTALQYGLRVDEYVDERRDPVRATDAALDYIAGLHERFGGSWYLAAAAFNAGPGRVERILKRYADGRVGDEDIYWEVIEHLPRETRDYVPKMLAVTHLANDADALGYDASDVEPYRFDNVFVPGGTSLWSVASALDIPPRELRLLNPHLVRGVTPPGEMYPVRVPVGGVPAVVAALADLPMRRADD